jgi:hypothetical protein
MGKAAIRRKSYQKRTLVELSHRNPALFESQWDMRLESWLVEVRRLAAQWRAGQESKHRVFEILENALEILNACEPVVASRVLKRSYDELSHECSSAVASVVDGRLYRLSNTKNMMKYGR